MDEIKKPIELKRESKQHAAHQPRFNLCKMVRAIMRCSFWQTFAVCITLVTLIMTIALTQSVSAAPQKKSITVVVQVGTNQRSAYLQICSDFTKETGIDVKLIPFRDADYKRELLRLVSSPTPPDVVHWQASTRLFEFAKKGVLRPLTDLWNKEKYDTAFSLHKDVCSYNGEIYGIPFSYYGWGVYYNSKIVNKYGGVPQNWDEFLSMCEKIRKTGIAPLAVGTVDIWPSGPWFDFLDLRINGLKFHKQFLSGSIPVTDQRVQDVFIEWKKLVDNKYYNSNSRKIDWDEAFPNLFFDKAAFSLIGTFAQGRFGEKELTEMKIGYMPFPKINDVDPGELVCTEVFMLPKQVVNIEEAELFLKYIARPEVQSKFGLALEYLPPHNAGVTGDSPLLQANLYLLKNAKGLAQVFDRDTEPAFSKPAVPLFAEFIKNGDIKTLTDQLEEARIQAFTAMNNE